MVGAKAIKVDRPERQGQARMKREREGAGGRRGTLEGAVSPASGKCMQASSTKVLTHPIQPGL